MAYLCHYFYPEPAAPSARLLEFGRAWQRLGHEVTIVTGLPNHPTGIVAAQYRGRFAMDEHVEGLRVLRSWLYATPNRGLVRKGLNHLSFALSSVLTSLPRLGTVDVIVASSPSLLSVVSAAMMARSRGIPFVFEVRDLWPAAMADLQVVRSRPLLRILEALELALYRAAAHVVVVTQSFAENLRSRGVPRHKLSVIPNGADTRFFQPAPRKDAVREQLGLRDEVVVGYFGAHGISHGLDTVLEAAEQQRTDAGVAYLLVGDGAERERLVKMKQAKGLHNVRMLPSQPRASMPDLYASADICLVPLKARPVFRSFIPSKMFEIMACGRPIVSNVEGEARTILERSGSALLAGPGDAAALAQAVEVLAVDGRRRLSMGQAGRAFVLANFDREVLAAGYASLLEQVISPTRHAGTAPVGAGIPGADHRRSG